MHRRLDAPPLDAVLGSASAVAAGRLAGEGPAGRLPLTPDRLREEPSGNLFGLTQNVGMGWSPQALEGPQYVIVSTHGGLRSEDGSPVALGYHTGHWEIGLLVREAAQTLRAAGAIPFAAYRSDPCDGRTQGPTGLLHSLPCRNNWDGGDPDGYGVDKLEPIPSACPSVQKLSQVAATALSIP